MVCSVSLIACAVACNTGIKRCLSVSKEEPVAFIAVVLKRCRGGNKNAPSAIPFAVARTTFITSVSWACHGFTDVSLTGHNWLISNTSMLMAALDEIHNSTTAIVTRILKKLPDWLYRFYWKIIQCYNRNNNNNTLFKHREIRDCCPVRKPLHGW